MTTRSKLAAAFAAAALSLASVFLAVFPAYGQAIEWTILVDGSPLLLPRPVVPNGNDLLVPLIPITRALGFQVEPIPQFNSLRLRRGAGAPIEYDGRTGEIRYGPVVAGQLRNYKQVTISEPIEEMLFPVDGLITLLAVDVQLDPGTNVLYINSSRDPLRVPSAHRVGLSSLDYSLGVTKAEENEGHYAVLRSDALAGGIPLNSTFLLAGEGADLRLQQGTVIAEFGRYRQLTAGDQIAISGIDSMISAVRGVGFSTPYRTYEASAYAGRTAGSFRSQVGAPSLANYDSTIFGGNLRTKSFEGDLFFGANGFSGPERKGTSAGAAFSKTTERHQMKAQVVVGTFSGLSVRTRTVNEPISGIPLDPTVVSIQNNEKVQVEGPALGFSFFDTFKPIEPLTITGHVARYSRNFLTPREDSEFNAQSTQRVSITLRPLSMVTLYGGITRRSYLAGDTHVMHGFNYGAGGVIPQTPWLHLGYFRVAQNDTTSSLGRLSLAQYSATIVNLVEYSGSFMFSDHRFNGSTARTFNVTAGRNFSSWGYLTLQDQLQLGSIHRYGAEWQLALPRGDLRLGLDRVANLRTTDRYVVPRLGLAFKLPGRQRLVATYSGERGNHTLSIVIGGPVINREDVKRDEDGRVKVISQAALQGRVYFDFDEDNIFNSEGDSPMSGITVWLDNETSTITDSRGLFRFDHLKSGTHRVRVDIAEVPADMVFADTGERRVPVLPFRDNVQDFPVVRTGSLAGKVTYLDYTADPDKPTQKPLPEARVIADSEHDTYSDLSGNITIASLKPGVYQLKVDPETAPEGYVAVVEPREIQVKAGETLRDVRIHLVLAPREVIVKDLPKQEAVISQ
jgi:hypothetical protein